MPANFWSRTLAAWGLAGLPHCAMGSYLNYHEDFSSMLMATGFAVAAIAYLLAPYLSLAHRPFWSTSRRFQPWRCFGSVYSG
jgi:hypothetical protein